MIAIDNFNSYYSVKLKRDRIARLERFGELLSVHEIDFSDADAVERLLSGMEFDRIVHLGAQAGVRYSLENPMAYAASNLSGHLVLLELARHRGVSHMVYASSSSVYGNKPLGGDGFKEDEPATTPVSLYAATKRSCELMSESYASLYGFPQTGLRFFTVYGPWGRPDMAYFSFTQKILRGEPIEVYGEGRMARDFTYVDDIVDGIVGALDNPPEQGQHRILNIGDSHPVGLMEMIEALEAAIGRKAEKIMRPMQPGDVTATYADVSKLAELTGYKPKVMLAEGLQKFADWYMGHYHAKADA